MNFSKEILAGISLVCVGVAGVAYLYSRRNDPITTDACAEQKITEEDLERQLELCKIRSLALEHHIADEIYTVKQKVEEQLSEVRTKLNRLDETVAGLMRTAETNRTAERITEKNFDGCNFGRLKTRVRILERDVTKIKIRALSSSVKPESGEGAAAAEMTTATENCFERTKPNAQRSTSLSPTGRPPTGRPPTGRPPTGRPPTGRPPTGRPPVPRPLVPRPLVASWYNNMIVRSRLREAEKI